MRSLLAVEGMESCAESSSELELVIDLRISGATGDMALRKSMYATGGVIGVVLANSSLMKTGIAERGVLAETAERADSSEGKVAVTGVVRPSLGRGPGMVGEGEGEGEGESVSVVAVVAFESSE